MLKLASNVKGDRKNFYCYISGKVGGRRCVNLLLNGAGDLGRADTDKAEVLRLLAWVFRTDVP